MTYFLYAWALTAVLGLVAVFCLFRQNVRITGRPPNNIDALLDICMSSALCLVPIIGLYVAWKGFGHVRHRWNWPAKPKTTTEDDDF